MTISDLKSFSYTPYSDEPSVCIVRSVENNFFPGVRIENGAYPLTICAMQCALFNCLSEGNRPKAAYVKDKQSHNVDFWKSEYMLWLYDLEDIDEYSFDPLSLSVESDNFIPALKNLLPKAQTVHSDFPVAALLETDKGYISGVNIECTEWDRGLCAERVAISKALSYGITEFKSMHIHARDGEFSSPCGACRQVLIEHMPEQQLHLYHADNTVSVHFTSDLLPHSFHSTKLTGSE